MLSIRPNGYHKGEDGEDDPNIHGVGTSKKNVKRQTTSGGRDCLAWQMTGQSGGDLSVGNAPHGATYSPHALLTSELTDELRPMFQASILCCQTYPHSESTGLSLLWKPPITLHSKLFDMIVIIVLSVFVILI